MNNKLISIGGAYVDINAPQFPLGDGLSLDSEVVGNNYVTEPGGSAVNFARVCSSMEIPTLFIGKVGKDDMGTILASQLAKCNVEHSLIESESVSTNVSFNMVDEQGRSIMAVAGTANQELSSEEVLERASAEMNEGSYLYIGGCFKLKKLMPAFIELVELAKKHNAKIILDHGRINDSVTELEKETVRNLALKADIYLPSIDEFMELWNPDTVEDGLKALSKQSEGIVVIKDGSRGAITIIEGEIVRIPAFEVNPLHTIGAGDSFNAGFISAQLHNKSLVDSVRFACATGALMISESGLPTFQKVESFMLGKDR